MVSLSTASPLLYSFPMAAKPYYVEGLLTVDCPRCGFANTFGEDRNEMFIFFCESCGEPVEVEPRPPRPN
jgi:hypothetical protein